MESQKKIFNKIQYNHNYTKQNYDYIQIIVPKGAKELLKKFAKDFNISVSRLFVDAFEEKFDINLKDFKKRTWQTHNCVL